MQPNLFSASPQDMGQNGARTTHSEPVIIGTPAAAVDVDVLVGKSERTCFYCVGGVVPIQHSQTCVYRVIYSYYRDSQIYSKTMVMDWPVIIEGVYPAVFELTIISHRYCIHTCYDSYCSMYVVFLQTSGI